MCPPLDEADDLPVLRAACAQSAAALLSGHGSRLLAPDRLAAAALAHLRSGVATDPWRAAMHAYSHALHTACSGTEGRERQELGYTELFHYLASAAQHRYRDVAEDASQQALERTYRRFAECRHPGTFLAFALQILRDAAASQRIAAPSASRTLSLDDPGGSRLEHPGWPAHDPLAAALDGDRRRRIAAAAAALRQQYPRAQRQLDALLLKYLDDLDDETIAAHLDTTVENVYVLRARAAARLQADPQWRLLAAEFGLLPEPARTLS